MFESNKTTNCIPGYTGHIPMKELELDILQSQNGNGQIPGYAGYISGVKSENMFGKTYGKITLQSATKDFHKGADLPPSLRYASTTKDAFISQQNEKKRQEVQLMQTKNNKGIHDNLSFISICKFFGVDEYLKKMKETQNQQMENITGESKHVKFGDPFEESVGKFFGENNLQGTRTLAQIKEGNTVSNLTYLDALNRY